MRVLIKRDYDYVENSSSESRIETFHYHVLW